MVRKALDDHVVAVNADDAFDDANGNLGLVERAALLDVELDVRMPRAFAANSRLNLIGSAGNAFDRV